jgi:hypothetical protein
MINSMIQGALVKVLILFPIACSFIGDFAPPLKWELAALHAND